MLNHLADTVACFVIHNWPGLVAPDMPFTDHEDEMMEATIERAGNARQPLGATDRLAQARNHLGRAEHFAGMIEARIHGPVPTAVADKADGEPPLLAAVIDVNDRADALANRIEAIWNAL